MKGWRTKLEVMARGTRETRRSGEDFFRETVFHQSGKTVSLKKSSPDLLEDFFRETVFHQSGSV